MQCNQKVIKLLWLVLIIQVKVNNFILLSNLSEHIIQNQKDEFYDMSDTQRKKALKDMAEAINILTDEYNKGFRPENDS